MTDHDHFMAIAIAEAKAGAAAGEQPFGGVVARGGELISQARSLKVGLSDSTAHSELLAIRDATTKLRQRILTGCTFYATCEPCPMCLGAIYNAGIETLVVGARKHKLAHLSPHAFDMKAFTLERFAELTEWNLTIIDGVREAECLALYTEATVALTR